MKRKRSEYEAERKKYMNRKSCRPSKLKRFAVGRLCLIIKETYDIDDPWDFKPIQPQSCIILERLWWTTPHGNKELYYLVYLQNDMRECCLGTADLRLIEKSPFRSRRRFK